MFCSVILYCSLLLLSTLVLYWGDITFLAYFTNPNLLLYLQHNLVRTLLKMTQKRLKRLAFVFCRSRRICLVANSSDRPWSWETLYWICLYSPLQEVVTSNVIIFFFFLVTVSIGLSVCRFIHTEPGETGYLVCCLVLESHKVSP